MLEIKDVRAGYGAINVLWDVSLSVPQGQLTTIVGPNGAGKTTLLRAIMGLIPLTQGSISFEGRPLGGASTWDLLGQGIAMIPEGRMVFKDMSIEENLMLGAYPKSRRAGAKANCEKAYALFPRLKERRTQLAGTLSGGEAQMLAMGRGLMSDPHLLIIDEPSLGLAPVIVNELFDVLAQLKKEGRTIVLVEQNTHKAVGVADHVHLMQGGKIQFSQAAADVDIEALHELYFAR
ncbi:ABC transporter ATP-binding protein [Castellaniella caeni]